MHFFLLSELNLQNCLPSDKSCSAHRSLKFTVMIYGLFIIAVFLDTVGMIFLGMIVTCYMHYVFFFNILHFFFRYWQSNLSSFLPSFLHFFPSFSFLLFFSLSLFLFWPPSELQEIPVATREQSWVLCFHSR